MEIRNAYTIPAERKPNWSIPHVPESIKQPLPEANIAPPILEEPYPGGNSDLRRRLAQLERRVAELEKQQDTPDMPIKCAPAKDVIAAVCSAWGVRVADLLGPRRTQKFSRPRHAAMALMREHSAQMSFPMIARAVNRGDHTTVMHGIARAAEMLAADQHFAALYAKAEAMLSEAQNG